MSAADTLPCPRGVDPARWQRMDAAARRRALGVRPTLVEAVGRGAAQRMRAPEERPAAPGWLPPDLPATERNVAETIRRRHARGESSTAGALAHAFGYVRSPSWLLSALAVIEAAGLVKQIRRRDGQCRDRAPVFPAGYRP